MTTEEEFQAFVSQNRDLIERMIAMQKGAAEEFIDKEKELARDVYDYSRARAEQSRARTEEMGKAMISVVTDPEIQRHFLNMGLEFFLGMSAIMAKAPMPDFVRDGYAATKSNVMDAACRTNEGCTAKKSSGPTKVEISVDDEPGRDVEDVFSHEE